MDIERLIKEAHQNAIDKGFYDCPECGGTGYLSAAYEKDREVCGVCNKTGIDPNKNIGELLMLIVSELGEALEAHRCGRFVPKDLDTSYFFDTLRKDGICHSYMITFFTGYIKDTFEDEIADVFIRLFDLCGYLNISVSYDKEFAKSLYNLENVGENLYCITVKLPDLNEIEEGDYLPFEYFFTFLVRFCQHHNIPIEKHIEAKMEYNKTRPAKHGKEY